IAVAAMIIGAISLLVISRYGSISNLTRDAEIKAESLVSQGQQKIHSTGAMARYGFQRVSYGVNSLLFSGAAHQNPDRNLAPRPTRMPPSPQPRPQRDSDSPNSMDRDKQRKQSNQSGQK
ncbi:MAG: hypothetical protein ACREAB_09200, partial [Blastocatellia bacterium]